ncbi:MAG: DUF2244 domain-containing protein [Piscinibacter sp.]|nr:DUF2244 domain-containing protein [Piscinibacter sp.]
MSTTTTITAWRVSPSWRGYHFGHETGSADGGTPWSVQWDLRRNNNSLAQRQMVWTLAALGMLALGIAAVFWQQGAPLVLPFAGIELLMLAAALGVHLRHAGDREHIALRDDGLTVEHACGRRIERVEFQPIWVRVEPRHGDRSLIELSGQGRRIAVGRFVRPELRLQLADELRRALRRWQQRAGRARPAPEVTDSTTD